MIKCEQCVELDIWRRIYKVLIDARANSNELLEECENKSSSSAFSKKELAVIDMYDNEIIEVNKLIDYMADHNGN